jgi:cyclopropane-fatty-acyl-phospholipid synthase
VTVSAEQQALARDVCAGLPVEIELRDYRAIEGRYDRVVTIGMVEHIGHRHYGTFMRVVDRCLTPDGLMLLHSIFANEPYGADAAPWLNEYIFPNAEVPSLAQVLKAAEGRFVAEAIHHFDGDYERTLASWLDNFRRNWPTLAGRYDERFRRMWEFYLMTTRGIFLSRTAAVRQIVFSKNGARRGSAVFPSKPEVYEAR